MVSSYIIYLLEEVFEFAAAGGMAEFAQCLSFYLADTLPG